jgi:hypothetical protein
MVAILDEAGVPYAHKVGVKPIRVRTMEAISEKPREIIPMGNPEDESPVRGEEVPQRRHPKGRQQPGAAVSATASILRNRPHVDHPLVLFAIVNILGTFWHVNPRG